MNSPRSGGGPTLPLIRAISRRVLPLIARTPITPNQRTIASQVLGRAAARCYLTGAAGGSALGTHLHGLTTFSDVARRFHV